ncbi:MAG: GHMP kinase [Planctomycetota bacterium]
MNTSRPVQSAVGRAYARAGLLGNPSDGYNGRTISFIIRDFSAGVSVIPRKQLTFVPHHYEATTYESIESFYDKITEHSYYGGIRLLKAATKRFFEYCQLSGATLHNQNFQMSYETNIPRLVGLAGSSAIVTAALRALSRWYGVEIPPHLLASLTLSAESDLGIPAGLQDRVIQAYEGLVYMDFSHDVMKTEYELTFGNYRSLDPTLLTNVYVAYARDAGQSTEVVHNDLRRRFNDGEKAVVDAMQMFADIAKEGVSAIESGNHRQLHELIDQNFDLRNGICQLHSMHSKMIESARSTGASAKFSGSGGAIVGTYTNDQAFDELSQALAKIGCVTFRPGVS